MSEYFKEGVDAMLPHASRYGVFCCEAKQSWIGRGMLRRHKEVMMFIK